MSKTKTTAEQIQEIDSEVKCTEHRGMVAMCFSALNCMLLLYMVFMKCSSMEPATNGYVATMCINGFMTLFLAQAYNRCATRVEALHIRKMLLEDRLMNRPAQS